MHKTDLIKAIANDAGLSQKDAAASLESFLKIATKALKKGDNVTLIGFGTFKIVKRAARKGRNPQTGKEIQIKASKSVKFTAGKALKDSVKKA
jgi:DNA-binding protein HU-beta